MVKWGGFAGASPGDPVPPWLVLPVGPHNLA